MAPVIQVRHRTASHANKQANKQAVNREAGGGVRDMFTSQLDKHLQSIKDAEKPGGEHAPLSRHDNRSRHGSGKRRGHTPGQVYAHGGNGL